MDATLEESTPVAEDAMAHDAQAEQAEGTPQAAPAMSKSAMKKAAKAERIAAQKLERRAREKEMRKEKKRALQLKRAAGELDENEEEKLRAPKRPRMSKEQPFCQIVVDLGFDDKMSDNEVKSLASQLGYTYSANRRAPTPFKLLFTGLGGRTLARLESQNNASYKRWQGTEWWTGGYEGLWEEKKVEEEGMKGVNNDAPEASGSTADQAPAPAEAVEPAASAADTPSADIAPSAELIPAPQDDVALQEHATDTRQVSAAEAPQDGQKSTQARRRRKEPTSAPSRASAPQPNVVYLTADSEVELSELKGDETYVIGGICDHNRYKNLCLNKAKESGIRTARLPIGRYLADMPTRKVLTVNQVIEIMVKWVETRDWEKALLEVMPKRKFNPNGRQQKGGSKAASAGPGGEGEGEGEGEAELNGDDGETAAQGDGGEDHDVGGADGMAEDGETVSVA
ncbi:guanine-1-methyltransferase-domain-containing protein [Schizophyllum amplum]|uniref:tRNA (guanine(9)-N1)-methyltransferase n=1 Tax=Schizophyllum amplum TaxID=97359 RepID=A0A550CSV7_9AGAR|nr:guanine-1-methyltransferase-domain-containing protein [Auriculariopsis ampla]